MKDYCYFIPGYTGFCPELREHFGQTYGRATRCIIHKNPNLHERLAPVHYRCCKFERTKGVFVQYPSHERDKCDYSKSKHRTEHPEACEKKHRTDYNAGDPSNGLCLLDCGDHDIYRGRYHENCENVYSSRLKCPSTHGDGDKIQKMKREYVCPKYILIKGLAECVQPEMWTSEDRQELPHDYFTCAPTPCTHIREYSEHNNRCKKCHAPKSSIYHATDCGHMKDTKLGTDCRLRKGQRVRPHRHGGVIPKYTGHVPGMQFSFGESYGPVSDRLLQNHHCRMKELKRKS